MGFAQKKSHLPQHRVALALSAPWFLCPDCVKAWRRHKEQVTASVTRELASEMAESDGTLNRMRAILDEVAIAVKGEPGPLEMHSWHNLPARVRELRHERDEA